MATVQPLLFCFHFSSVCYDRAPWYPTALTFILSALWHGIYPGYYFTFLTGILITLAARAVCTFHCSLLRLDTIQLSAAPSHGQAACPCCEPSFMPLQAWCSLKLCSVFMLIAKYPAVITNTNSDALLSLAVRGNVAWGCIARGATSYIHAVKLAWDSRSCGIPDFCWVMLPVCWLVTNSEPSFAQEAAVGWALAQTWTICVDAIDAVKWPLCLWALFYVESPRTEQGSRLTVVKFITADLSGWTSHLCRAGKHHCCVLEMTMDK